MAEFAKLISDLPLYQELDLLSDAFQRFRAEGHADRNKAIEETRKAGNEPRARAIDDTLSLHVEASTYDSCTSRRHPQNHCADGFPQ